MLIRGHGPFSFCVITGHLTFLHETHFTWQEDYIIKIKFQFHQVNIEDKLMKITDHAAWLLASARSKSRKDYMKLVKALFLLLSSIS